jgi:ribonuclease J
MAVLSRMANREHKIELGENDTVILASSLIPGNENAVFRVIDGLMRLGANVVHKGNAKVHVSGHASGAELLYTYNIVQPKNVMPIHGEYRHLVANARLALETGVPSERTLIGQNGTVVDLRDGEAEIVGQLDTGSLYVDGSSVGQVTEADLKDRRVLGEEGFISVITVISEATANSSQGPRSTQKESPRTTRFSTRLNRKSLRRCVRRLKTARAINISFRQVVRRTIGRWVGTKLRRRAMIVPVVVEV